MFLVFEPRVLGEDSFRDIEELWGGNRVEAGEAGQNAATPSGPQPDDEEFEALADLYERPQASDGHLPFKKRIGPRDVVVDRNQ